MSSYTKQEWDYAADLLLTHSIHECLSLVPMTKATLYRYAKKAGITPVTKRNVTVTETCGARLLREWRRPKGIDAHLEMISERQRTC